MTYNRQWVKNQNDTCEPQLEIFYADFKDFQFAAFGIKIQDAGREYEQVISG